MPTMGITGSKSGSPTIVNDIKEATLRAFNKGWNVATRITGNSDIQVIKIATESGNASKLTIYLNNYTYQYNSRVITLLNDAKNNGATIVENAWSTGIQGWITDKLNYYGIGKPLTNARANYLTNKVFYENCDALNIFNNNNARDLQRLAKDAFISGNDAKPINIRSYLKGILKSSTIFNCLGMTLGAIGMAFEYDDMQKYLNYLNKLLDKYKNDKATPEEIQELTDSGVLQMSDAGNINTDDIKLVSSGHRGNPYHDRRGRFCSAADAAVVSV